MKILHFIPDTHFLQVNHTTLINGSVRVSCTQPRWLSPVCACLLCVCLLEESAPELVSLLPVGAVDEIATVGREVVVNDDFFPFTVPPEIEMEHT